ncbi:MAG: hypothetical protein Q9168_006674 [Polycauliona sp. 1 TL-2023]
MRLIDTSSYEIVEFPPRRLRYAILSHTWGEDEYLFADRDNPARRTSAGFQKVSRCCALAASEGFDYLWVDTCCIDKISSAELTESINSMYRWYAESQVCYVYLSDFALQATNDRPGKSFRDCRWFTRGWTLQELLAPVYVVFYDLHWIEIGSKSFLQDQISQICRISPEHIEKPRSACIAVKMSWASERETSRQEDTAYCLLGLFEVNMPLIYGEGENAFYRLQRELIESSSDESIFAWTDREGRHLTGLLASSPRAFEKSHDVIPTPVTHVQRYYMTKKGLAIGLQLSDTQISAYYMTNKGLAIDLQLSDSQISAALTSRMSPGDVGPRSNLKHLPNLKIALKCAHQANDRAPIVLRLKLFGDKLASRAQSQFSDKESVDESMKIDDMPMTKQQTLYVGRNERRGSFDRAYNSEARPLPANISLTPEALGQFSLKFRSNAVQLSPKVPHQYFTFPPVQCDKAELILTRMSGYAFTLARDPKGILFHEPSPSLSPEPINMEIGAHQGTQCKGTPQQTQRVIGLNDNMTAPMDDETFLWIKSWEGWTEKGRRCQMLVVDVSQIDRRAALER